MSDDDQYFAEYEEPTKLSEKQRKLVDAFVDGATKVESFHIAGYTCGNPDRLDHRVNAAFRSPLVKAEIRRRHDEQTVTFAKLSPLDVMIENMNFYHEQAHKPDAKMSDVVAFRGLAQKAAEGAAPYVHPRLQAIAHMHRVKRSIDDFTDDELAVIAFQTVNDGSDGLDADAGTGGDAPGPRNAGPEGTGP